jgi:hypothetical protein
LRRARECEAARRVDSELLLVPDVDGCIVSPAGLVRLQRLVGGAVHRLGVRGRRGSWTDGAVRCTVARTPGLDTRVTSPEGTLTFRGLRVELADAASPDGVRASGDGSVAAAVVAHVG